MNEKLTIYLVDDHNLFREGLRLLLSKVPYVEKIHEAANGQEFIDNLKLVDPDIVLIDIEMPVLNGIKATQKALELKPALKIIALSMLYSWCDSLLVEKVFNLFIERLFRRN